MRVDRRSATLTAALLVACAAAVPVAGSASVRTPAGLRADPPRPFLALARPHRLSWAVVVDGSAWTKRLRVVMGEKVAVQVRGAFSGGTVSVRIFDAAERLVFRRAYSQAHRPTGAVVTVRGRAGRWTFTFLFRGARGGPFRIDARG